MARLKTAGRWLVTRTAVRCANLLAPPLPFGPLDRLRLALLRMTGMRVASGSFVSGHFFLFDGRHLRVGERCSIGAFARIWDFAAVEIGDDLLCSHNLTIVAGTHETWQPYRALPAPVRIGNGVWIGVSCTIVGPCTIGDGVILGANSFATGDLSEPGIYAGSPARLKRALPVVPASVGISPAEALP